MIAGERGPGDRERLPIARFRLRRPVQPLVDNPEVVQGAGDLRARGSKRPLLQFDREPQRFLGRGEVAALRSLFGPVHQRLDVGGVRHECVSSAGDSTIPSRLLDCPATEQLDDMIGRAERERQH